MSVVLICDAMMEKGGVERIVALQIKYFQSKGENVFLLTRYGACNSIYNLPAKVIHESYGMQMIMGISTKIIQFFQFSRWVNGKINDIQPKIIMIHGLNVGVLSLLMFNNGNRGRAVVCDHNHFDLPKPIWKFLRKILYKKVKAIISLTKEDLPKYQGIGNAVCIYNPVTPMKFSGRISNSNVKTVLAVGRLTYQKGFDLLLRAWSIVVMENRDWLLKLVGSGPDEKILKKLTADLGLNDAVVFYESTDDINKEYENADLLAFSSRYEGFSLVMLEAISAGLPVIAFNCKTGPKEVLATGGGAIVPAFDIDLFAKTLLKFMCDKELREKASREALMIARKFSIDEYYNNLNNLLEYDR